MPENLISISYKYIKNLTDFCSCIFPKTNPYHIEQILNAIKEDKLQYGELQKVCKELNINYNVFNATLRRLRSLGIITKNWKFSEIFQLRLTALSQFYSDYANKPNKYQKLINKANELLKPQGIVLQLMLEEEPQKEKKEENKLEKEEE